MPSSAHPLAALWSPLRYASARDFANLAAVKDLKGVLAAAIARAAAQGMGLSALAPFRAELLEVDAADPRARRASIERLLKALERAEGIGQRAEGGGTAGGTPPPPEPSPLPPPAAFPSEKEAAPPPRGRRRPAKADDGDDISSAPARLLSIAPAEGPLSLPLKGLGMKLNPRMIGLLDKKGIRKIGDVLFLLPRTYEDRTRMLRIAQLEAGKRGTVVATVRAVEDGFGRGKRRTFRAVLADSSGSIAATYFQTGPWLKAKFPIGRRLVISGEVRQSPWGWEIPHPEVEPADDLETSSIHFNCVVPVYPGFERHEQRALRELVHRLVEKYSETIAEPLPEALRLGHGLLTLPEAVRQLHFAPKGADVAALEAHQSPAHRRLAFDELFFLQLGMALRRQGVRTEPGIAFDASPEKIARGRALLPFEFTGAQNRVVQEIARDMARPEPMNRLLQGDVGSGKTAVALCAAAIALQNGHQVAVMAPTEILAEQHYKTFSRFLAPLGVEVAAVLGGATAAARRRTREALAQGRIGVAVGTHALIQEGVEFHRLGLAVIDEQHRFGVIQRHALMAKGPRPDVLVMTATPIPRTLAMTLYGDLDVSVIDELPPGRTPIETRVYVEKAFPRAWDRVKGELERGHQAYVVYPLVEESEKMDLLDATRGAKEVAERFPAARVGLLHGRLKPEEKDAVMAAFRDHQLDILVCTTVVEVGVDVPNASVMVIEHAERFGLSQLHQLRGRVGRGASQSYCFLLAGYAQSEVARTRLSMMEESSDGFAIAEKDLELRGAGEFLGTRQSGMPELAVADLGRDQALLAQARDEARAIVERDPGLELPEHRGLVKALEERWEGRLKLARVG